MSEKIIRVAQIIGIAAEGGVESMIMNLYRNIDHKKVQFDFFVESTSKIIDRDEIERLGGKVIIVPKYTKLLKYISFMKKALKEGNYDIVHSNMNSLSVFPLYAARRAGIKIRVAHSHSTSNSKEKFRNFVKNILRNFSKKHATHYVACSEKAGRWLFGNAEFDKKNVRLVNNAIDLKKFTFNNDNRKLIRDKFGIKDEFVVGNVGRFVTQKNHSFLLDIFYKILKFKPEAKLLLVGDGPLKEELVLKAKKLNIYNNVIFAGVHKNVSDFYDAFDCFVLSSLYEGLPVVGVEAQVKGLNCYFSDTITKEVQVLENMKFISLSNNAEEWANIILSDNINNDRSNAVNHFVGTQFDINTEADKLTSFYEEIIKGGM